MSTIEPTNFKRAVIYLRVSTEEQVENYSLDTQEDICRKEAARKGYNVVEVFREEGKSAKSIIGRPMLIKLLEYCRKNKNNIQAVFVYRIDRISRQTADYLAIRKKLTESDVKVISATEPTGNTPTEKLVETILAGFAQLDNDVRSERTKNGMRARFLSGLPIAKPPLGYILQHGYAMKDPQNFDKMKQAWDLMATGTKSLAEMTTIMRGWDIYQKNRIQCKLRPGTLNRIFRNKFYMGMLTSESYPEEIRGQHTLMINEEQFYRVQAILDGRNVNKISLSHRVRDKADFPLRRIVHCGRCGSSFTGGWSKGRTQKYAYYRCSGRCTGQSIRVEKLEVALKTYLKTISPTEQGIELFQLFLLNAFRDRKTRLEKVRTRTDAELESLYATRRQLVEKNLSGIFSDEIFKEQNSIIEEKIANAQIAKQDDFFSNYDINKVTDFVRTKLADLSKTYEESDISQKKVLLGSIFPSGLLWNYFTWLNHTISPIYQSILTISGSSVTDGDP